MDNCEILTITAPRKAEEIEQTATLKSAFNDLALPDL